jgi:toxin CcdB
MARFDVYTNPDRDERSHTPFILDLQNGFLDALQTFAAVPLRTAALLQAPVSRLQPILDVDGQAVVMDTPMLAAFPRRSVSRPIANLRNAQFEIQDALDTLFGEY